MRVKDRGESEVSPALFHMLTFGDLMEANALLRPGESAWPLLIEDGHKATWYQIVDKAVAAWAERYPGTRCANWWRWSAPDLRQVFGRFAFKEGDGRCQKTGIPYGSPVDPSDLPMVESTPAYLDRHRLWIAGERERVQVEAFEPQVFAWSLIDPVHVGTPTPNDWLPKRLRQKR